jgi:hypothetical protein
VLVIANVKAHKSVPMFFASRTHQRVKVASLVLLVLVGVAAVLGLLFPQNGGTFWDSFRWWVLGIPIGLVAWLGLEWCGTTLLGFSFWQKMPSAVRVPLLVAIIVIVIIAAVFIKQFAYAL